MIVSHNHWQEIRAFCRDDEAYRRMLELLTGCLSDGSERQLTAQQTRDHYTAILHLMPDRVFRVNRNGDGLDFKGTQEDTENGIRREDVVGTNLRECLPPDIAEAILNAIARTLETGTLQTFEYQLTNTWGPNEELRDYEVRLVVCGEDEVLAIERDITERKHAERKLEESATRQAELYQQLQTLNASLERLVEERTAQLQQKMVELQELSDLKDEFLHAVSHDLRTPMMGMRLVLQNLQKKVEDPIAVSHSVLERMVQSLDRQLAMIRSLLDAQSSDVRGISLTYESLNLGELVTAIVEDLAPLLSQNQATLSNHISSHLPPALVDPAQIRRVLENLLTNALQHNPPGLHLTLTAQTDGDFIRFCVQDNGIGMAQEECDSLFDRYVRGARARRAVGVGLGLYLCKQIIMAHGGEIGVTSAPGKGATFWFTLPQG
ncbi:MAG: PAS domain-containing sensor histidine kinase [Oscillatoriales cyanobacterium C42_A2020_001]|nr:PAS domain-containing sensor histidine kinase [Leptolyngbyaceae cyanobacterium C42_A2020_001]